jgi:transcription initiation factor TFIID subunit 5
MSAATPAPSSSGGVSPTNASAPDVTQNANSIDRLVLDYLRNRGHKDAERVLNESIENGVDEPLKTVSAEELIKSLAVYAQKPSRPGDNVLKESANVLQELTTMGNPPSIQNLIASLGTVGAEEILSVDPTDKEEGFRELEAWVEGSLDMYKVLREYIILHRRRLILCNSLNFDLFCFLYFAIFIWILCSEDSRKLVCLECLRLHTFNRHLCIS